MLKDPQKNEFWRNVLFALVALSILIQLGFELQRNKHQSEESTENAQQIIEKSDQY